MRCLAGARVWRFGGFTMSIGNPDSFVSGQGADRAATAGRGGRGAVESGLDYQLPPMAVRDTGSRLGSADRFGSVRFPRDHRTTMRTDRLVCLSSPPPPVWG